MDISTTKRFSDQAKNYAGFYNEDGQPRLNIEGIMQIANADGETLSNFGGGGGVGGGNTAYSNASGDFTATITNGTKNITITGLPFTLEAINVAAGSWKRIDSTGIVTDIDTGSVSVSGGVITFAEADDFVTGDVIVATVIGPDKAYDVGLDNQLTSVQNPTHAHFTDVEHIIDSTNDDTTTIRTEFYADCYNHFSIHLKGSGGVTFTIWATNDDTATTSADTGWVDITNDIIGAASLVDSEGIYFVDTPTKPLKFMIKYITSDATNASDVWIRKYS